MHIFNHFSIGLNSLPCYTLYGTRESLEETRENMNMREYPYLYPLKYPSALIHAYVKTLDGLSSSKKTLKYIENQLQNKIIVINYLNRNEISSFLLNKCLSLHKYLSQNCCV